MNSTGSKTRDQIKPGYKWNIEAMYPDESLVEDDRKEGLKLSEELASMQGHVMDSPASLLKALDLYSASMRLIEKAYIYTHMKHDEDNGNSFYTEMNNRSVSVISQMSANTSFLTPELLESDTETVMSYVDKEPGLEVYRFMLENIMLMHDHTLTKDQEYVLATVGEALGAPGEIFTVLNDVDMVFGSVTDENGETSPLTHASYSRFMESPDRNVRLDAYTKLYSKYKEFNNTLSTIYNFSVKTDLISSSLRNYPSTLNSALDGNKIPLDVYHSLISAVHDHLPSLHKYVCIRKKALGLSDMKMHDIYVPLVKPAGLSYTFEEAVDIACEALAPLGEEYVSVLRRGLLEEGWVDVYENKGKTSGAYSFGSYDSYPYILMNFTGDVRDIFTLVHEGGHSMHSYYTRKTQPYIYGDHSIFTAEVASTVNETLLIRYLLDNTDSKEMKAYLLNFYIDEFKSTLYRQTMFAEFELAMHKIVEEGGSLTSDILNSSYYKLNSEYYGPQMSDDDMIQYEWSRIPHFYRSYYVYQYATGYSAANAITNRILSEGAPARDDYLRFLTTGSSDHPIELLKIAGVDMSSPDTVGSALNTFDSLVDELQKIMEG